MDTPTEELQPTVISVERFGDGSVSMYGSALSALLTRIGFTCQLATSRLLQESGSQQASRLMGQISKDKTTFFQATSPDKNESRNNYYGNGMQYCYCDREAHVKVE